MDFPTYEEVLKLKPDNKEALVNMMGLIRAQYPEVALRRLLELYARNPNDAGIAAQIGITNADLGHYDDISHIREVGAVVKDKLEKSGYVVGRSRFSLTHEHPLASTVNAVLGILMALGILIVFLSSSLIANTLSALLNQHLRHIGVIKLVGGQRKQVFYMYLALIMAFSVLALLIAVPFGGVGSFVNGAPFYTRIFYLGVLLIALAWLLTVFSLRGSRMRRCRLHHHRLQR